MIEEKIKQKTVEAIKELYDQAIDISTIQLEKTNKEHKGDFTLVVFPLLRFSRKSPQETALEIGDYFLDNLLEMDSCDVIKGFLNLTLTLFSCFTTNLRIITSTKAASQFLTNKDLLIS